MTCFYYMIMHVRRAQRERERETERESLLLKSCRVRRGALEALGPGSPGVLISG